MAGLLGVESVVLRSGCTRPLVLVCCLPKQKRLPDSLSLGFRYMHNPSPCIARSLAASLFVPSCLVLRYVKRRLWQGPSGGSPATVHTPTSHGSVEVLCMHGSAASLPVPRA